MVQCQRQHLRLDALNVRDQRGFSLVELLVAIAVAALAGTVLLIALRNALAWSTALDERAQAAGEAAQLFDRLAADEDSAWAIFVPPQDVAGISNADGHELDFFSRDGAGRDSFWAYRFDAQTRSIQRYRYAAPNGAGATPDGTPIAGVAAFAAHAYPLDALQNVNAPLYNPLYAGAALHGAAVHFFAQEPWIAGGNGIVAVHVDMQTVRRELQLTTQTVPSGWTVVLRYTPPPSGVQRFPAQLEYPSPGGALPPQNVAVAAVRPRPLLASIGAVGALSRLAATAPVGPCPAGVPRAFDQQGNVIFPGRIPPWAAGLHIDVNGCDTGRDPSGTTYTNTNGNDPAALAVAEPGGSGNFTARPKSCQVGNTIYALPGQWYPTNTITTTANFLPIEPLIQVAACEIEINDSQSIPASAIALIQIAPPCFSNALCQAVTTITTSRDFIYCSPHHTGGGYGCIWAETGYVGQSITYAITTYNSLDGGYTWSAVPGNSCSKTTTNDFGSAGLQTCKPALGTPAHAAYTFVGTSTQAITGTPTNWTYGAVSNAGAWKPQAPPGIQGTNAFP